MQAEIREPKLVVGEMPIFLIRPASSWSSIGLKELWEYRELLYFLVWRDVKVRYKQTALGAAWAIIQPLMMMVVFSLFSGIWQKCHLTGFLTQSSPFARFSPGNYLLTL